MSITASSVVRGSMIISASRVLVNLIGFLSTITLARLLVPEDFGIVAISMGVLAIVNSFTSMPLSAALIQRDDVTAEHYNTAFTLSVLRALFAGGLLVATALPIAHLYDDMRLVPVLIVIGGSVVLLGFNNPMMAHFVRTMSFARESANNVLAKLLGFLVALAIAYTWRSYWALVIGGIASQLFSVLMSYVWKPYWPRFTLSKARDLLAFSWWMTLSDMVNTINWRLDQLLLGNLVSRTALGFYSVGGDLAALPTREATQPLTQSLFPALARIRSEPERLRRAVLSGQSLIFLVAFPVGLGFSMLAEPLVRLVLTDKWSGAIFVIQALAFLCAVQTLVLIVHPLALANGSSKQLFVRDLVYLLVRAPIVVVGVLLGGIKGVVIGRLIVGLLYTAYNMHFIRLVCGLAIRDQFHGTARTFASGAIMCAALWGLGVLLPIEVGRGTAYVMLIAHVVAGALVFVATQLLLWRMSGCVDGPERRALDMLRAGWVRFRERP